jgi:hypothetical protein
MYLPIIMRVVPQCTPPVNCISICSRFCAMSGRNVESVAMAVHLDTHCEANVLFSRMSTACLTLQSVELPFREESDSLISVCMVAQDEVGIDSCEGPMERRITFRSRLGAR